MKNKDKKYFYLFVFCISLSLIIMGATFAYFSARTVDKDTVKGETQTLSFGLSVEKVTFADLYTGLIPLYDDRAPYAAVNNCVDDNGNAVCQIYKINASVEEGNVLFIDGYITMELKEGVDMAFTRVYPVTDNIKDDDGTEHTSIINYKVNELYNPNILDMEERYNYILESNKNNIDIAFVSNGVRNSEEPKILNYYDDSNCLLFANEQLGGEDSVSSKAFYVMIWLHDTGESQDDIQGITDAYSGTVTLLTAEGNQIKATF